LDLDGLELLEDDVVLGLELSEWGTELEVLDHLGTIIDGLEGFIVLSILMFPDGLLSISGVLFSGLEWFVIFDILNGLSEIVFWSSKSLYGIITEEGVGSTLSIMVLDIVIEVN
jgi:hypothetical protein